MTLEELFPEAFSEGLWLSTMPELELEIPVELLVEAAVQLDEGQWQDAHISGMRFRVDPERPDMKQHRHVHVAAKKNQKTKARQASWNVDGSRHDKKTFNSKLGSQQVYRDVARKALGLGNDVLLEAIEVDRLSKVVQILESAEATVSKLCFRASRRNRLKKFSDFLKSSDKKSG